MCESTLAVSLVGADATERLGAALARSMVRPPISYVVHLDGDLGSGKTTLVRSLLRTLGVRSRIASPTYTLVESYRANDLNVLHVDLYRTRSPLEVRGLGLREALDAPTLVLCEWAIKGANELAPADLCIELVFATPDSRAARIHAPTALGQRWLNAVRLDPHFASLVMETR